MLGQHHPSQFSMLMTLFPLLVSAALQASAPAPESLPEPVRLMIEAAIEGGNAQTVEAVIGLARKTNPQAEAEIVTIEAAYREKVEAQRAAEEERRIAEITRAGLFDRWSGQVELGASRATGNSNSLGLFGATNLTREGLSWRHKFSARADIQETNNVTTTERVLAAWQPNYKVGERLYMFGLGQYEHDRFLGYSNRYTLGGGAGYGVISGPAVKLDIEGGPALRHTDYVEGLNETKVAGRASMTLNWKVTPTLQFGQTGSLYLERGDSSASAATTLDTKLIGALKARFSYNIQYERDAPAGVKPVDTLSRATLVYSF